MLRPNDQRAKIAIYLVAIVTGIRVISLISDFLQFNLLQNPEFSMDEAEANDLRQQVIAIVYIIIYIISGVTFIQWFRRAYYNLHTKVEILSFEEGWASGAWFVPIMNLGRPYVIMKEMYNVTNKLLEGNPYVTKPLTLNNVNLWWTLWIISAIFGQVSYQFTKHAATVEQLTNATVIDLISAVATIPLGLITIKVIKEYSYFESILIDNAVASQNDENLLDTPDLIR